MLIDGEQTESTETEGTLLDDGQGSEETSSNETSLDETKAADDKANDAEDASPEEGKGDDADSEGEAETISYEDLEMPEGIEVDEAQLADFTDIVSSLNDGKGLSVDDTQKLLDFRAAQVKFDMEGWAKTFSDWRKEMFSDREIGGREVNDKGIPVNYTENVKPAVLAALQEFGDDSTVNLFKTQRAFGEHPGLTRLLYRVGLSLQEDQLVRGRLHTTDDEGARQRRLYPSHYNEDGTAKN
jgi:hypothetical protein